MFNVILSFYYINGLFYTLMVFMNYLAHFYLSNYDENLIIGNYIADDVKGKAFSSYPSKIQEGILLHRAIDDFTDNHEVVALSKNRIRAHQQKYSPVVIDVLYDYFLANNWKNYSKESLKKFSNNIYKILFKNIALLPIKSQLRLSFMYKNNWLYSYREIEGIRKALTGLSKRTSFSNNMHQAHLLLNESKENLESDFKLFFPEIIQFVSKKINS